MQNVYYCSVHRKPLQKLYVYTTVIHLRNIERTPLLKLWPFLLREQIFPNGVNDNSGRGYLQCTCGRHSRAVITATSFPRALIAHTLLMGKNDGPPICQHVLFKQALPNTLDAILLRSFFIYWMRVILGVMLIEILQRSLQYVVFICFIW